MKAIAFDIYGTYAHFKTWYMTTSRTTYPLPPRTVIAGIVGAIMGIDKDDLPKKYSPGSGPLFGVRALKPIKTRMFIVKGLKGPAILSVTGKKNSKSINIKPDEDIASRIPIEIIESPEFRIYVNFPEDSDLEELSERIRTGCLHFRPYLGTANMVAFLRESVSEFTVNITGNGTGTLGGLMPKENIELDIQQLRKNRVHLTEVVAQKAVTDTLAYRHGEFLMDMGAVGIPGRLIDIPYVIDNGLTIPLL